MNKELIKNRFGRKLFEYNNSALIQKQMSKKLAGFLKESSYETILEIGCGTGFLTKIIVKSFQYKDYTALDIVPDCVKYISKISDDINFINQDAENYIETSGNYDLIISNASFQWIEDFSSFVQKLVNKLKPNGTLLFSTFGENNFKEISNVSGKSLHYYSSKQLMELFQNYKVQVEEDTITMHFETPKDVLKHIQNTGVNAISNEVWTKKDLYNFETKYNEICNGSPVLTYNPIYVFIRK